MSEQNFEQLAKKADVLVRLNELVSQAKTALDSSFTAENLTASFYGASEKLIAHKNMNLAKAYFTAGEDFSKVDVEKMKQLISQLAPLTEAVSKIASNLDSSFDATNTQEITKAIVAQYQKDYPKLNVKDMVVAFSDLNGENTGKIVGTLLTNSGKTINRIFNLENGKVVGKSKMSEDLKSEFDKGNDNMNYCPHCGAKVLSEGEDIEFEDELFSDDEETTEDFIEEDLAEETGDDLLSPEDFDDSEDEDEVEEGFEDADLEDDEDEDEDSYEDGDDEIGLIDADIERADSSNEEVDEDDDLGNDEDIEDEDFDDDIDMDDDEDFDDDIDMDDDDDADFLLDQEVDDEAVASNFPRLN